MGKDLHYTIRPFIEKVLRNHSSVSKVELLDSATEYVYKITRIWPLRDVIIVLNDDYKFRKDLYFEWPSAIKNGGILLIAKPEAFVTEMNYENDRIVVGKLARVLGALRHDEFWKYEPPNKDE